MEAASNGVRVLLSVLSDEVDVAEALLKFSRQMEEDYAEVQDINLFIFAIRAFFCWHRAEEFHTKVDKVERVRGAWLHENDGKYTRWLGSVEDNPEDLKWAKWTFQAKNSIFMEFLESKPRA
jgi:hypothetical protein